MPVIKTVSALWRYVLSGVAIGAAHFAVQAFYYGLLGVSLTTGFLTTEGLFTILAGLSGGIVLGGLTVVMGLEPCGDNNRTPLHIWLVPLAYAFIILIFAIFVHVWRGSGIQGTWLPLCLLLYTLFFLLILWDVPGKVLSVPELVAFNGGVSCAGVALINVGAVLPEILSLADRRLFAFWLVLPATLFMVCFKILSGRRREKRESDHTWSETAAAIIIVVGLSVELLIWPAVFPLSGEWFISGRNFRSQAETAPVSGPNIILLVLDTLRGDHLEMFGYPKQTMPFLTRYTSENNANSFLTRSHAASTLPSHATMFTGVLPSRHNAHRPREVIVDAPVYSYPLDKDLTTLAEFLSNLGYRTAGISANFAAIHPKYGLDREFEHYDTRPGAWYWISRLSPLRSFQNFLHRYLTEHEKPYRILSAFSWLLDCHCEQLYRRADEINHDVMNWLSDDVSEKEPFFLFINYFDPHMPYCPPREYGRKFFSPTVPDARRENEIFMTIRHGDLTKLEKNTIQALYDGELNYLDEKLEELINNLENRGHLRNTLLIITSDHGEAFGEHGLYLHASSLYDSQILVPMIIFPPREQPDTLYGQTDHLTHKDLFPMIAGILGRQAPAQCRDGFFGQKDSPLISELFPYQQNSNSLEKKSIILDGFKLINTVGGASELYDLASDPEEKNNRLESFRTKADSLQRQLDEVIFRCLSERTVQPGVGRADREAYERLKSLGYIQ